MILPDLPHTIPKFKKKYNRKELTINNFDGRYKKASYMYFFCFDFELRIMPDFTTVWLHPILWPKQ